MSIHARKNAKKRPFTLIEVVVVVIILVTLASVATPVYLNYVRKANVGTATTQLKLLQEALTGYKLDVGSYPDASNGLQALVENTEQNPKWDGPYLQPAVVPKDPWGNDYVYTIPGEHNKDYDLVCYGADGQPGGTGENADITNYAEEK
ncbi:MAG: type II secretion system major pseudopilin GspG [Lentisphaeria bacterium]|jgi:general secretion pathway protein G|nr:type II secretion system major pseudopilin GspG [Lentisphaeria bacterium]